MKSWSSQKHPAIKLFLSQLSGPVPVTPAAVCPDGTRASRHYQGVGFISARGAWKVLSLIIYKVKTGLQGSYLRATVYESWEEAIYGPHSTGKSHMDLSLGVLCTECQSLSGSCHWLYFTSHCLSLGAKFQIYPILPKLVLVMLMWHQCTLWCQTPASVWQAAGSGLQSSTCCARELWWPPALGSHCSSTAASSTDSPQNILRCEHSTFLPAGTRAKGEAGMRKYMQ